MGKKKVLEVPLGGGFGVNQPLNAHQTIHLPQPLILWRLFSLLLQRQWTLLFNAFQYYLPSVVLLGRSIVFFCCCYPSFKLFLSRKTLPPKVT